MNTYSLRILAVVTVCSLVAPAFGQVVLNIDQASGLTRITNTGGTTVNINGYDIRSIQNHGTANDGLLDAVGWDDLESNLGNGWLTTNFPSSELLIETNANNVLSLGPGASRSLGNAFTTNPSAIGTAQSLAGFGNEYRDVTFQYTDADNGSSITNGDVNYNNGIFNNLVLNVQLGSGNVQLKNDSSVAVEIEAYIINSAAGSLNTSWNGLSDTVANWEKNIATNNALAELSRLDTNSSPGAPLAPLTINGGATFDLGTAFNVGGAQDLSFSFLLTSDTAGNGFAGEVRYVGLLGDYNGNGTVDAADYTIWRDTLGSTADLRANGDNAGASMGVVDAADYNVWKANFGSSAGGLTAIAAPVPEPTSVALGMLAIAITCGALRRERVVPAG